jgi:two-component sensor histidine kinase
MTIDPTDPPLNDPAPVDATAPMLEPADTDSYDLGTTGLDANGLPRTGPASPSNQDRARVAGTLAATGSSLGMAIVVASTTPLILLDDDYVVRAVSGSFCRLFRLDPKTVTGASLFAIGNAQWDIPQLRSLLRATLAGNAAIDAYELDLAVGDETRKLVLNAQRLDYSGTDMVNDALEERPVDLRRLLIAVLDVTALRLEKQRTDALLREKQVLLQELQHRVANSLQIIASVLMQSVRRVQSEEARTHLNDAHHRVMSIATLQRQLAQSAEGDVALRGYFGDLCSSIGASMISDQQRISITPTIDASVVSSDQALSLGLIVTELVINALKHAFPSQVSKGRIEVLYAATGDGWALTVSDDGRGMPANSQSGLGTGIIEALAGKLKATVKVSPANPGTCVTVACRPGEIAEKPAV